uniref:NADH-cytochrome b5 reductase n=1 Tax=Globisporangium ultimum (strain ATCC 200006 / CBS 805.95 / DAOM BR144) TaxID=431595 RepID=K3WF09_GLOUD
MWTALRISRPNRQTLVSTSAVLSAMGLATATSSSASNAAAASTEPKVALSAGEFRTFKVSKVEDVTHDTKRVVFDLPGPDYEMGLSVASCLLAKADINGAPVVRPYTPVNTNSEKGVLELVVKGYPKGLLSKHIVELQVGDSLEMKGPFVKFKYEPNTYKKIGFIAGGSGLTPLLQVAKEILRNPADETEVTLVFANNAERDIILREELDALAYMYPQFKVHYVLSQASEGWTGRTGFVTKEIIQELLPAPSDENLVCVCGPPPMMEALSGDKNPDKTQGELRGLLKELQYTSSQVYKF